MILLCKNIFRLCWLNILIVILLSCTELQKYIPPTKPVRYPSPSAAYKRDSIFFAYTVRQYQKLGVETWRDDSNLLQVEVDTILYDRELLRFFSIIMYSYHDTEMNKGYSEVFNAYGIIGYRSQTHDIWNVYRFPYTVDIGFYDYNRIKADIRKDFFEQIKFQRGWFWNPLRNDYDDLALEYNVNDPKFWDSSIVWKKGVRIPGYYLFQTPGNYKPQDSANPSAIIRLPKIDYPDSLIKQ